MTRFQIFILVVASILAGLTAYVGSRVIMRWSWAQAHREIIWLTAVLFIFLQVLGPYLYRKYPHFNKSFILHWVVYTSLGVFACMLFYTVAADLVLGLWKAIFRRDDTVDLQRRAFLTISTMAFGSSFIGTAQAVKGPRIYKVDVPIENLPEEFEGFRIVQVSDLHVGPTIGKKYTENVVQKVNDLGADLVALTGDFVDGTVAQIGTFLGPISNIRSKHGMYFVTGNHEYYWGAEEWLNEFNRLGARTLNNEHFVVNNNGKKLVIAGVTDHSSDRVHPYHQSDPVKSIQGAPQDSIKILLAHQPKGYEEASKAGFHLQLSGHTHGGQFFPWSIVVGLAHRYYKGLNRHEKMWIYVSRGSGYWGPPLRFAVPSEITCLTLRRSMELATSPA